MSTWFQTGLVESRLRGHRAPSAEQNGRVPRPTKVSRHGREDAVDPALPSDPPPTALRNSCPWCAPRGPGAPKVSRVVSVSAMALGGATPSDRAAGASDPLPLLVLDSPSLLADLHPLSEIELSTLVGTVVRRVRWSINFLLTKRLGAQTLFSFPSALRAATLVVTV